MLAKLTIVHQLTIPGLLCLLTQSALAQAPVSVTVLPSTVTAGSSTTGIVALSAKAKAPVGVTLASNNSGVTVPDQVTVAAGKQSVSFTVSTLASDPTAIVTLTASGSSGTAVGFFMVEKAAATPLPGFAGLTFSPSIALSGQTITGTITFSEPLVVPITFNLTSANSNFTVPSEEAAKIGAKSVSFPVTVGAEATTGAVQVTAALAAGIYTNAWAGPLSTSGSFDYVAGAGLPKNYTPGFWVGPTATVSGGEYFTTLKTYPDGRLCLGWVQFSLSGGRTYYQDAGPYLNSGHVGSNGQINLESAWQGTGAVFPENGYSPGAGSSTNGEPSYLYDGSTLSFSSDGKTATLKVVAQEYTWTLSLTPTIVLGNTVTLGTYTFTRVE